MVGDGDGDGNDGGAAVRRLRRRRCKDGGDGGLGTAASRGGILVAGARSGSGRGGVGDDGWTPSPTFHEQPLEMEETPFLSQMTARVCEGGPFPSYTAQNGPIWERAHLRPTTQNLKYS